jgi:hypothetical protein
MTKQRNSMASTSAPAQSALARWWWYPALFGMQTIGAIILLWNAVPLYQQILADPAAHEARPEHLVWGLSSIVLMQLGYWISDRVRPPLPQVTNVLLGHITLFLARMSFVFATSVFGFLFITQRSGFHIPVSRYAITLLGLFALYCYGQEMERLGRAFLGSERKRCTNVQ